MAARKPKSAPKKKPAAPAKGAAPKKKRVYAKRKRVGKDGRIRAGLDRSTGAIASTKHPEWFVCEPQPEGTYGGPRWNLTPEGVEKVDELLSSGKTVTETMEEIGITHSLMRAIRMRHPRFDRMVRDAMRYGLEVRADSMMAEMPTDRDSAAALTARATIIKMNAELVHGIGRSLTVKGDKDNPIRVGVVVVPKKDAPDFVNQQQALRRNLLRLEGSQATEVESTFVLPKKPGDDAV